MKSETRVKTGVMVLCAAALTVIPAVMHGHLTNRWGEPADMQAAADRLDAFPAEIGEWRQLGDTEELSPEIVRELKCRGYLSRRYVNRTTADEMLVMVMVGPPGPLVRHPPEICYGNRANDMIRDPEEVRFQSADGTEHSLRLLRYRAPGIAGSEFSILYGWSTGETWSVPDFPRLEFGAEPLLFKLQLLSFDTLADDGKVPPAVASFLEDFLPQLDSEVFVKSAVESKASR